MILVCGEAVIDLFVGDPAADGSAALSARAIAGGSPFNVAVGLARLGAHAGYFGGISSDALGDFLIQRLRAEQVDTTLVRRSPAPTPLAVVARQSDGQPAYTFHAAATAYSDVPLAALPAALPPDVTALALGSFSLSVDPLGSTLLALAEREAGRVAISLDPNLRPALAGDPAAWRTRFARFARTATIIKLSIEDLHLAWGPVDPAVHAAAWLADGAALVVVTDGANGATGYHPAGTVHARGRTVKVVDTVGAGDTFHAALLARLAETGHLRAGKLATLDRDGLGDLLHFAVLASSVTCTRRGADLPTRAEVLAADGRLGEA